MTASRRIIGSSPPPKQPPKDDVGPIVVEPLAAGATAPLVDFMTSLVSRKDFAQAETEKTTMMSTLLSKMPAISSQKAYDEMAALLRDVKRRRKQMDEDRKVIVQPLNKDVDEINSWYMPGIKLCAEVAAQIEKKLESYILRQRAEEARLKAEAEAKAKALVEAQKAAEAAAVADVSAPAPEVVSVLRQEVVASAAAVSAATVDKAEGVTAKKAWSFTIVDASLLDRRFLKPDEKAIATWVAEHGDVDVPAGVAVTETIKFTTRT